MSVFKKVPKLTTLLVGFVLYIIAETFSYFYQKQLEAMAKDEAMPELINKIGVLFEYLTHPYVLVFLLGGLVFSFPEWRPYIRKIPERIKQWVVANKEKKGIEPDVKISFLAGDSNNSTIIDTGSYVVNVDHMDKPFISSGSMNEKVSYYKSQLFYIHECKITNHSDAPIFTPEIPVTIKYYKNKSYPNGFGEPDSSRDFKLELYNRKIEANSELRFLFINQSPYIAYVCFHGHINGKLTSNAKVSIPYIDESWRSCIKLSPCKTDYESWRSAGKNGDG